MLEILGNPSYNLGSQDIDLPLPAQGPNSREANLPRSSWGFDLQEVVMPQPA